jgi:methylmalonyl-CoA/ethylmalonyl-CoA epimerase
VKLHHVGVVVNSVKQSGEIYANKLGMRALGPPVQDDTQRVIVQFWALEGDDTSIELIEPLGEDSPVSAFLRKGGGMAHICFQVDDIDRTLETAKENGAIIISGPVPATAFHRRRVAFVFYGGIGVTEFVEKTSK